METLPVEGRAEPGFLVTGGTSTTGTVINRSDGRGQDATRRIDLPIDQPGRKTNETSDPSGAMRDEAPEVGDERTSIRDVDEPEPHRGRGIGFAFLGTVIGILLTFVVIALTTGGGTDDLEGGDPAVAELEAQLEERNRQIDELEARVTDLDARIESIDVPREELDNRESALDERAAALDRREAELPESEAGTGSDPATEEDGGTGSGSMDLDGLEDAAEGIGDRALEEVRRLFGQAGG